MAYERPPDQAWRCLAALTERRVLCPPALVAVEDARRDTFRDALARFSSAVGFYIEGDIARARDHRFSRAAVEGYLKAYEAAPTFGPASGVLRMLTEADPRVAEFVRARLAARSLDHR